MLSTTTSPQSETAAVRRYLTYVGTPKRRGRRVTVEDLQRRLERTRAALVDATSLDRVLLIQERMDLEARIDGHANGDAPIDVEELEAGFIAHGFNWAERKGLSYDALRHVGVPARVLRAAGF